MTSRKERGAEVVRTAFGGALYQQGRGFYSVLELLAILRGELLLEQAEDGYGVQATRVLPSNDQKCRYLQPSHDHARRLLVSDKDVVPGVFADDQTRAAVQALLRGIEAPVPGRLRTPDRWQVRHFYPYPAESIHYDAVQRGGKISVERYQFRGAGGLAHRVLRRDPDAQRLAETRETLRVLMADSGSAIGSLMQALASHDNCPPLGKERADTHDELLGAAFTDAVEGKSLSSIPEEDATQWMELLREGVHRLLRREELSDFSRIDGLMHWVPWCLALHQLAMARRVLQQDEAAPLAFDAGHKKSAMRTFARSCLARSTAAIRECLHALASVSDNHDLLTGTAAWWTGPRSFFTTTLFAVGAVNSNKGRRHFEVRPQLLQTIVHALVDSPISLEEFSSEVLGRRLQMICDVPSAAVHASQDLDKRHLQTNGELLKRRLDDVGLLRAYSDSTVLVGVRA